MLTKSVSKLHQLSNVRAAHFSLFRRQAQSQATRAPPSYQVSKSEKEAKMDEYYNSIGYAKLFGPSEKVYSKLRD